MKTLLIFIQGVHSSPLIKHFSHLLHPLPPKNLALFSFGYSKELVPIGNNGPEILECDGEEHELEL